MKSYKPLLLPVLLLCMMDAAKAQMIDTVEAEINPQIEDNRVKFGSVLRPLRQVAGAPPAFYSYFWEFGDGTYSFEKEPVHFYKDTGVYEVRLYATNNYDDGKKPNTRRRRIPVNRKSMTGDNRTLAFFSGDGSLEIKTNEMPKPGEDMVFLVGYRNKTNNARMSGSIMLLYNEKQFSNSCFEVADARTYHQEKAIGFDSMLAWMPSENDRPAFASRGLYTAGIGVDEMPAGRQQLMQQVKQEMSVYRKHNIWRVNTVAPGEEKIMFLSVNTLPEMIQDTNAVVTITGLFVPDDPDMEMEKFEMELQIVASHDPNRIMLKRKRLNYRFTGKNRNNNYKIQFQNTGKGPAKRVAITVTMPGLLNTSSLVITGMKPVCRWCDSAYANQSCLDTLVTKDSVQFIFKNIYLPGTQQDGVTNPDSTMGFIKYQIRFGKKMKKLPFESRAAIVFDKNPPIYTNRSKGRFKKGLSPGIMLGYGSVVGSSPDRTGPQNYVLGFTLSEFAAYRKYFQWELFLQSFTPTLTFIGRQQGRDTIYNGVAYKVDYQDNFRKEKIIAFEAVPVEFRYNLASFASAGIGALVAGELSRTTTRTAKASLNNPNGTAAILIEGELGKRTESFAAWRGALFADAQLGKVRVGPAVGIRFMQYFNPSHQRILLYATWKF
jgi:hypothetical protein